MFHGFLMQGHGRHRHGAYTSHRSGRDNPRITDFRPRPPVVAVIPRHGGTGARMKKARTDTSGAGPLTQKEQS